MAIALYLLSRWRLDQLDWRRDLPAAGGLAVVGLLFVLLLSGSGPLALVAAPLILALGGTYLVFLRPSTDRLQRTAGWLALASGFIWVAIGFVRLLQR